MPKITHIEVSRERNYRTNPEDKYQVAKIMVAVRAELADGDDPKEVAAKGLASCDSVLREQIEREQDAAGFPPIAKAEDDIKF